jgi:hypothetical protein
MDFQPLVVSFQGIIMTPTPVTLSPDELNQVLKRVAPNQREFGGARICRILAAEHSVVSVRIHMRCSVSNISDIVNTGINPKIKDLGLRVACTKPAYQILNQFGQPSAMNLWSFYRTSAANDSDFQPESVQDALRRDYSAITADYMQGDPLGLNEPITALDADLKAFDQSIAGVDFGQLDDEANHHAGR